VGANAGSSTPPPDVQIVLDTPYQDANVGGNPAFVRGWEVSFYNGDSTAQTVAVFASCVQVTQ
jgi:hypothetical protein